MLEEPDASSLALRGAHAVLRDGWVKIGDQWLSRAQRPVVGDVAPSGSFNYFGMSLAVATVLRHEPQHATARAIWTQLQRGASATGQCSWLAPGVR